MNSATSFNLLDLVALIVILVSAVLGFRRGLIGQIVPVLSFIVVALTGWFGLLPCHDWLARVTTWCAAIVWLVTILLVIVVPLAIVILLGRRLVKLAQQPVLIQLDRAAGTLSGLAGGILAVVLVLLVATELPARYQPESYIKGSWTGRHVIAGKEQTAVAVSRKLDDARDELLRSHKPKKPKESKGTHEPESWER